MSQMSRKPVPASPAQKEDAGEDLREVIERARRAQRLVKPQIRPARRNPRHFAEGPNGD